MATLNIPHTEPTAHRKAFGLPVDTLLLVFVGALVAFGLMMVYSATFDWSYRQFGDPATIFLRQLRWLGLGLVMMLITARMPYRWWRPLAVWLMLATLGALVLVLLFGVKTFNAQRSFFNGSVQPSELAKFVVIIYLAVWLDSKGERIREIGYGIFPFGFIVGLVAGLIVLQPDLSAAGTVVLVATLMFFISGADLLQMGVVAAGGSLAAALVIQASATGRQRLVDYLAGVQDITQASWHVQQAAIAFVNGGLLGRGLGESHQKFGFLPTPHTDSIFAIVGEELGLVGCLLVIGLFVALAWRGFTIASQARDPLGSVLAAGLTCWVSLEALINVAVMLGAVPFAGNALPFISYGGSNLVMMLTAMGVLLSISRRDEPASLTRRTRPMGQLHQAAEARPGDKVKRDGTTFNLGWRDRRRRVSRIVSRSDFDG